MRVFIIAQLSQCSKISLL